MLMARKMFTVTVILMCKCFFFNAFSNFEYITAQIRKQQINKRSDSSVQNPRSSPAPAQETHRNQRYEIFKIVCNNIDNWRDFGLCLGFNDTELNWIAADQSLHNTVKLFTNRILEQAEEKFGNQFQKELCRALRDAYRNDILRKLKELNLISSL